jgi:L-threonylcarbamoyladenylate synthase
MKTEIVQVSKDNPDPEVIKRASEIILSGGLVAFPTETVYGLGANALDTDAVAKIYLAKGRPSNNPLIVHVASIEEAMKIVAFWSEEAELLSRRFWPGPLTMVLPKRDIVPENVTGGGSTVAVRFPAHRVARDLIMACKVPLAAPSANRSMRLSPTTADHVRKSLGGRIDMILDGGPTLVGVESTVIDLSQHPAVLLRPGGITPNEIENVIGSIALLGFGDQGQGGAMKSPGMMKKHYSPQAPLECVEGALDMEKIMQRHPGERIGILQYRSHAPISIDDVVCIKMPGNARKYASRLYAALHALDEAGVVKIYVEFPPEGEEWMAVRDRLKRASAK